VASEESKTGEILIGAPISDFEAAVGTLQTLQREGKYQVFLVHQNNVRLYGDIDQFRVSLARSLGPSAVDPKSVEDLLQEVQLVLQLVVGTEKVSEAARILEENVYEDKFEAAKEAPAVQKSLREVLLKKVELVCNQLTSEAMRQRAKRLSTVVGPLLHDLDFELVSQRRSSMGPREISSPFLRLRLRYSLGGKAPFPFFFPPWIPTPPGDTNGFELECDETDIDLLVARLIQAKELLKRAIEVKVQRET
jgi:hypothetical protein